LLLQIYLFFCTSQTVASPQPSQTSLVSPMFGGVPQHLHVGVGKLRPPFKRVWVTGGTSLIEFPPAIGGGVAYAINKYGNAKAIQLGTRKVIGELSLDPKNKGHQAIVTGPAYYRGNVYGAFLDGTLAAGNGKTGKVVWEDHLHAHLESSPLPVDGNLYLGTDSAQVIALDAADGHTVWTFKAPGAIKASPSYDQGNVFVADYQSSMFALNADTGKPVWRTNTSKVAPYGSGGFFSSPAIGFGTVFAARDAAHDSAISEILEVAGIDARGPACRSVEAFQTRPHDAVWQREQPGEHDKAADDRNVGGLRRRAQRVGERRVGREIEDLKHGIRLCRKHKAAGLAELPLCVLRQRGIGPAAQRNVSPRKVRVVELVELG